MRIKTCCLINISLLSLGAILLYGCMSADSERTNVINNPNDSTPEIIELTYDSTIYLKDSVSYGFVNCEVYFSDENKTPYRFNVYADARSLNGYHLHNDTLSEHYKGARFQIEWASQGDYDKDSNISINRIESLKLLSIQKYLKHKQLTLTPKDDISSIIFNAEAGDSIILKAGVYSLPEGGININADYVTLIGEPGTFINRYFNCAVLSISANNVYIKNLHLSNPYLEDSECMGYVVDINAYSGTNVTLDNCDIKGGVTGIIFYGADRFPDFTCTVKNCFIHNNSEAPFESSTKYQSEDNIHPGIKFSNNKIWNNGAVYNNEPAWFKEIFTFGLSDSLRKSIYNSCKGVTVYHFREFFDSYIPYHAYGSDQVIGYINPHNFYTGNDTGILVLERFNPIKFYAELPADFTILKASHPINDLKVISYDDYNYDEITNYYSKMGIEFINIKKDSVYKLHKLIPDAKKSEEFNSGYYFIAKNKSLFIDTENSTDKIIKQGDDFFIEQMPLYLFYRAVQKKDISEYDLNFSYQPTSVEHMRAYLKEYIKADKQKMFLDAPAKYNSINTDTALLQFYFDEIIEMETIISDVMYNCGIVREYEESEYATAWEWINNYVPFLETQWECSECSSEANIVLSELVKKANTTDGELDNILFETLSSLGDSKYPITYGNAGCDYCGYSLLGDGSIFEMINRIIALEKYPILFNQHTKKLADVVMNMGMLTVFGNTKEEVYNELSRIIALQDSTSFDLSNALKQKNYLDTTNYKIIYSCTIDSFTAY